MFGQPYYSESEYSWLLMKLFPPGSAFERNPLSSFYKLVSGFAPELRRNDEQITGLVGESEPLGAENLIGEWETDYGLPGCLGLPLLLADRQAQLYDKVIWPGNLKTGWSDFGNLVPESDIIDGIGDHTDLLVGDAITIADGLAGGKYEVIAKPTANSIQIEQPATHLAVGVQLEAYFNRGEASKRYFYAVADYLGYTINDVEVFPSLGLGVIPNSFLQSANSAVGSPILVSIADTSDIEAGQFVSHPGFPIGEHEVLSKTASSVTLAVDAIATIAGENARGYDEEPLGMTDAIGDGYRFAAQFDISLNLNPDGDKLECVFEKLRQAHVEFLYNFS